MRCSPGRRGLPGQYAGSAGSRRRPQSRLRSRRGPAPGRGTAVRSGRFHPCAIHEGATLRRGVPARSSAAYGLNDMQRQRW